MSELANVKISDIDPNPLRRLADYPYNEDKLETLIQSIKDVGLWEGIIGRRWGNRVQIAFGHHRVEAARRSYGENGEIAVIVRDLSDEQMLQFMGRENLEEYNADFLVMLETWEAAVEFVGRARQKAEPIDIARLLGWTELKNSNTVSNDTARACDDAAKLIAGGYMGRKRLEGLSVKAVREVVASVIAQHQALERMAKQTKRPAYEIEHAKQQSGKAGERVARDIRSGQVAHRDIRGQVHLQAYRFAKDEKQQSPLFAIFGKNLAETISRVADTDTIGEKCAEIKKALGEIVEEEDIHIVKRIAFECDGAAKRFDKWANVFTDPKKKVVNLGSLPRK